MIRVWDFIIDKWIWALWAIIILLSGWTGYVAGSNAKERLWQPPQVKCGPAYENDYGILGHPKEMKHYTIGLDSSEGDNSCGFYPHDKIVGTKCIPSMEDRKALVIHQGECVNWRFKGNEFVSGKIVPCEVKP